MGNFLHPSLTRLYDCPDDAEFLYIDETVLGKDELLGKEEIFYAITAAKFEKSELPQLRKSLIGIVSEDLFPNRTYPYWHATEALQTETGERVFENMLSFLQEQGNLSLITCKVPIPQNVSPSNQPRHKTMTPEENARRDCLRELITAFLPKYPKVRGMILEQRKSQKENDRDKSFLKALSKQGLLPQHFGRAWVDPRQEIALWVPDTVGMAYRRTRTHTDQTSDYFFDYLNEITEVREF